MYNLEAALQTAAAEEYLQRPAGQTKAPEGGALEARPGLLGYALGQLRETLLGGGDEMVALTSDPRHDRRAIDPGAAHLDAEDAGPLHGVMGLTSDDQQLGRHAAHRGAGGTGPAVVDQQGAGALAAGRAFGGEASGTGTDHGDIAVQIRGVRRLYGVTHHVT